MDFVLPTEVYLVTVETHLCESPFITVRLSLEGNQVTCIPIFTDEKAAWRFIKEFKEQYGDRVLSLRKYKPPVAAQLIMEAAADSIKPATHAAINASRDIQEGWIWPMVDALDYLLRSG